MVQDLLKILPHPHPLWLLKVYIQEGMITFGRLSIRLDPIIHIQSHGKFFIDLGQRKLTTATSLSFPISKTIKAVQLVRIVLGTYLSHSTFTSLSELVK
jgi:hypothetical protein